MFEVVQNGGVVRDFYLKTAKWQGISAII